MDDKEIEALKQAYNDITLDDYWAAAGSELTVEEWCILMGRQVPNFLPEKKENDGNS